MGKRRGRRMKKGKRRTEVLFGFDSYFPSSAKRIAKEMKNADVILLEFPQELVEFIRMYGSREAIKRVGSSYKPLARIYFPAIEKALKEGKRVIGYTDPDLEEKIADILEKRNGIISKMIKGKEQKAEETLELDKEFSLSNFKKEEIALKRILAEIKNGNNKEKRIFVHAGGIHTSLYIKAKDLLEEERRSGELVIKRKFFPVGNMKAMVYPENLIPYRIMAMRELQKWRRSGKGLKYHLDVIDEIKENDKRRILEAEKRLPELSKKIEQEYIMQASIPKALGKLILGIFSKKFKTLDIKAYEKSLERVLSEKAKKTKPKRKK